MSASSSTAGGVALADSYAAALSSPQTRAVFQKWRNRLAEARAREETLTSMLTNTQLSPQQRDSAQTELKENAIDVMFCAEQVQWYALHMSKVAAGDADPDLDNRQW